MTAPLAFIIPSFNAADTLADTVRSILAQTRPDWAAHIIDDGSTDHTASVARRFLIDPRIRLISQENRGLAAARNRGILESDSPFLCFLDADDVVAPDFAREMLAAIGGHDLAACACDMVGPQLQPLHWTIRPGDHDTSPARMIEYNPFAVGAVLFRRSAIARAELTTRHGPGLFDPKLTVHEDWDAFLRLTAAGAAWAPILSEPLFSYRLRAGSMSGNLQRMHDVGLEVIARAPDPPFTAHLKQTAQRHWTIRHLARAIARPDSALIALWLSHLDPLAPSGLDLLASTLRWSLCQQHHIGPGDISRPTAAAWRSQIETHAGPLAAPILDRLRLRAIPAQHGAHQPLHQYPSRRGVWTDVLDAIAHDAASSRRLIIYGIGRNGRDLIAHLERLCWPHPVAWMDDDPAATPPRLHRRPLPRITLDQLTIEDTVLVTPDRRGPLIARLRERGIERIMAPEGDLLSR